MFTSVLRDFTLLLLATLALSSCGRGADKADQTSSIDSTVTSSETDDGRNWTGYGRASDEQHFSTLTQVNSENIGELGLQWSLDLQTGPVASLPVEADGTIYLSTGLSIVRAVDAVTGKLKWEYDPKVYEVAGQIMRQGWGTRGLAYSAGKVFTGTLDGRLIALDSTTGALVWSAQTTEKNDGRYITGAPRVAGDLVVVGHGGADSADVRGYVTAYNVITGRQMWRFYTVPGNPARGFEDDAMARAAKTWSGNWWTKGGGGTVWNAIAYSADNNTIFIGTGNGAPWNHRVRSRGRGDNLYLCSIVALNALTGKYKWHYQINPGETWDYNAAMDMHLASVIIDGKQRKVLMQAPKNGYLYVLDQETGKLLAANRIAKVTWAKGINMTTGRPIEMPEARFANGADFELWPSSTGAHSATPSSYDPRLGLMFVPVLEKGLVLNDRGIDPAKWRRTPGNAYDFAQNIDFTKVPKDPLHNTSWLLAINPLTGKQAWRVKTPGLFNGGLMSSAGDLVFQGQSDGWINAYGSKDGKKLWSFNTGAPVIGAPITYSVKGRQYVTVISGMGTVASTTIAMGTGKGVADYRNQPRRLLTFSLGSTATLASTPPFVAKAAADPSYRAAPEAALRGAVSYGQRCFVCHGPAAISGGGAPDLRMSNLPTSAESFAGVVHGGALAPNGMPAFPELTGPQLDDLRQYLRERSAALRGTQNGKR